MIATPAPARPLDTARPIGQLVLLAAAVALGAFLALGGERPRTVTFDGEIASYDGPASFDAGRHEFVFDNRRGDVDAAFALLIVTDPTMTESDLAAEIDDGAIDDRPSYLDPFRGRIVWANQDEPGDRVRRETVMLHADSRYVIYVLPSRWESAEPQLAGVFEVR